MRLRVARRGPSALWRRLRLSGGLPYRISPALTFGQEVTSGDRESRTVKAVVAKNFLLASRHGMFVRKTRDFEPGMNAFLEQQPGAGFAQAAVHAVLLHRDPPTRFGGGFKHRVFVQR